MINTGPVGPPQNNSVSGYAQSSSVSGYTISGSYNNIVPGQISAAIFSAQPYIEAEENKKKKKISYRDVFSEFEPTDAICEKKEPKVGMPGTTPFLDDLRKS